MWEVRIKNVCLTRCTTKLVTKQIFFVSTLCTVYGHESEYYIHQPYSLGAFSLLQKLKEQKKLQLFNYTKGVSTSCQKVTLDQTHNFKPNPAFKSPRNIDLSASVPMPGLSFRKFLYLFEGVTERRRKEEGKGGRRKRAREQRSLLF